VSNARFQLRAAEFERPRARRRAPASQPLV